MPAGISVIDAFPDVLDPRFFQIVDEQYEEEKDMRSMFYSMRELTQETERWSEIGPMSDMVEFTGTINYDAPAQGFDANATAKEFALGTQIQRRLWEFDQFGVIEDFWRKLAKSAKRKQQKDAASIFNNADSVDTTFGTHSEGVPLVSASHTTTYPNVPTTNGFSNISTSALSPTALTAQIIQFRKFRDLGGEKGDEAPTHIVYPIDLRDRIVEILQTRSGLDAAEDNINVHFNRLQPIEWFRLTDPNNYFLVNEPRMKRNLFWFDKVEPEFKRMESFDHVVAKYRVYSMYTLGRADWRWILGAIVS